jgi:hypothetical protein
MNDFISESNAEYLVGPAAPVTVKPPEPIVGVAVAVGVADDVGVADAVGVADGAGLGVALADAFGDGDKVGVADATGRGGGLAPPEQPATAATPMKAAQTKKCRKEKARRGERIVVYAVTASIVAGPRARHNAGRSIHAYSL